MSDTQGQGKRNPLHYILASDRLIRLGYSVDEVNDYLRETSFDALVQANLEAMEARRGSDTHRLWFVTSGQSPPGSSCQVPYDCAPAE